MNKRTKLLAKYLEEVIRGRKGVGLSGGEIILYLAEDIIKITNPSNDVELI